MRIYVANLAAYVSGRLVGEWIELPKEDDELRASIQAVLDAWNDGFGPSEEPAIHDYELPFEVGEYSDMYKINEWCRRIEASNVDEDVLEAILDNYNDVEEALKIIEDGDYHVYDGCDDMGDVAAAMVDESGTLDQIPGHLRPYFDYDAYGRDLDIEGTFLRTSARRYVEVIG